MTSNRCESVRPTPLAHGLRLTCPACRALLDGDAPEVGDGTRCPHCRRHYPVVAGLLDLRLESDRYLELDVERARAEHLARLSEGTDVLGLASIYYELAHDAGDRRQRFLTHIAGAVSRGEALANRLPQSGSILEIGCGTGGLLVAAARSGRSIVGIDIAARWLVAARRRLADHQLDQAVTLLAASAECLPWPDCAFRHGCCRQRYRAR